MDPLLLLADNVTSKTTNNFQHSIKNIIQWPSLVLYSVEGNIFPGGAKSPQRLILHTQRWRHSSVMTLRHASASLFQPLFKWLMIIPVSNTALLFNVRPLFITVYQAASVFFYYFLILIQAILCKFPSYYPGEMFWVSLRQMTLPKATTGQSQPYNVELWRDWEGNTRLCLSHLAEGSRDFWTKGSTVFLQLLSNTT